MKCRPILTVNFNKVLQEALVHGTCAAMKSHFQFRRLMEHHIVGTLSKIHPHSRRFWASFISCSSSALSLASHSLFCFCSASWGEKSLTGSHVPRGRE